MNAEQKKNLTRIAASAILFSAGVLLPGSMTAIKFVLYLSAYLIVGFEVLSEAFHNILHGEIFDENFLMAIATIGAVVINEYAEAVAVMLLYQVGELFQSYAVERSKKSVTQLMDIRPDYANVEENGALKQVAPESVEIGQYIFVKPGERVPLDGVVEEGASSLNTSALTGEAMPREVKSGDSIISGCVNLSGLLKVRVTKSFGESTVSKILDLMKKLRGEKAKSESYIRRFARWYTPAVVISAVLLAVIPPLFFKAAWNIWFRRALVFLVVSCPCALVISVPLGFFSGMGGASKCGILIKGGNYIEALSRVQTVVFDKTGTLTKGVFKVTEICPNGVDEKTLLETTALAESYSDHPISKSLKEACGSLPDNAKISNPQEFSGLGISVTVNGKHVLAGNAKLMEKFRVAFQSCETYGTVVHTAIDGAYAGYIVVSDEIKEDSLTALRELKKQGVKKTVMLTGDAKKVGESIAEKLKIDEVYTELLPDGKVECAERLIGQTSKNGTLAFVGDGINDAPVLSRADIGIAMGAFGSDAAIEAADIVLMDDKPSKIPTAVKLSKRTLKIVRENIAFAVTVKLMFLLLSAFGAAGLWEAVFADVGVCIIAVLNSSRALHVKKFM